MCKRKNVRPRRCAAPARRARVARGARPLQHGGARGTRVVRAGRGAAGQPEPGGCRNGPGVQARPPGGGRRFARDRPRRQRQGHHVPLQQPDEHGDGAPVRRVPEHAQPQAVRRVHGRLLLRQGVPDETLARAQDHLPPDPARAQHAQRSVAARGRRVQARQVPRPVSGHAAVLSPGRCAGRRAAAHPDKVGRGRPARHHSHSQLQDPRRGRGDAKGGPDERAPLPAGRAPRRGDAPRRRDDRSRGDGLRVARAHHGSVNNKK